MARCAVKFARTFERKRLRKSGGKRSVARNRRQGNEKSFCGKDEKGHGERMNGKRIATLVAVVAIAVTAGILYGGWCHRDNALQGSGTVEARNIRVGSKIGGRIDKLLVREGDTVEAGQVLMSFDDKELLASLAQSRASA